MKLDSHDKGAFTVDDGCEYIAIGRTLMYELIRSGEIRVIKIGRRTLITRAELDRFLESRMGA